MEEEGGGEEEEEGRCGDNVAASASAAVAAGVSAAEAAVVAAGWHPSRVYGVGDWGLAMEEIRGKIAVEGKKKREEGGATFIAEIWVCFFLRESSLLGGDPARFGDMLETLVAFSNR